MFCFAKHVSADIFKKKKLKYIKSRQFIKQIAEITYLRFSYRLGYNSWFEIFLIIIKLMMHIEKLRNKRYYLYIGVTQYLG